MGSQISISWTIPTVNEETNGGVVGYSGAKIYRLVNQPDTTNWANPVNLVRVAGSTETTWTDTTASAGNIYYYRLTSLDAAAFVNQSFFTDTVSAIVDTFAGQVSLVSPADGHETRAAPVGVQWAALADSSGIDSYVVEASRSSAFTATVFADTVDGAKTTDTITGLYNDTYFWRIRAIDNAGNAGINSAVRGFILDTSIGQVSVASPTDGQETKNASVVVQWSAVSDSTGIDSYVIEASKSSVFTSLIFFDTVIGTRISDTLSNLYNDSYFWRVRAVDHVGNAGANSSTRGLVVDTAIGQVSVVSPNDAHETTNAAVVAQWSALADSVGIDSYALEVSNKSAFTTFVFSDTVVGSRTSDTITGLNNDTYFWRVRAIDRLGNAGISSAARGFLSDTDVDTVILTVPADGGVTADTTPTLEWNPVADSVGIDSYALEVSKSPAFASVAYSDTVDGALTNATTSILISDTYYWRVRAIDNRGNIGVFEDTNKLRIDTLQLTVQLVSPQNGAGTTAVSIPFSWSGINAETYTWQASKSSSFSAISDSVLDTTSTSLVRAFSYEDTFYWRVIAKNTVGQMDTATARGFLIDSSVRQVGPVSPSDGHETNTLPGVQWSALVDSVGIDSYVVEVSKSSAFGSTVFADTVDGVRTSDTLPGLYNDTYFWRVRGIDNIGNVGANSSVRGFVQDTSAGQISVLSPADAHETTNTAVVAQWTALADSVGVDTYVVEVSKTPAFLATIFADTVIGSRNSDTFTGLYNDTYFWRVRAIDHLKNTGANSTVRGFVVDTSVSQVSAVSPVDGHETKNAAVIIQWSAVIDSTGIDSYVVEASKSSVFSSTVFADTVAGSRTSDTLLGLFNDTYYWRVRAMDHLKNVGANSSARRLVLDTAADTVILVSPSDAHETENITPVLTWSALADSVGIDSYVLEVSKSSAFATLLFVDTVDGIRLSDTVSSLFEDSYYWRVRAVDNVGNIGANSVARKFIVDTPFTGPKWYVNDSSTTGDSFTASVGSDTAGDGTSSNPFRTITKALSKMKSGDTLMIDAGFYTETAVVDTNSIALIGVSASSVILDPPGDSLTSGLYGIYADTQSGLVIKNLSITGARDGIHFVNVDLSRLTGVQIGSNGRYGIYLRNGSDSNFISNNIFWLNTHAGMSVESSDTNAVVQNEFTKNDTGLWISGSSNGNIFSKNNLSGNTVIHLYNQSGKSQTLTRNWWGTADETAISSKISDTPGVVTVRPYRIGKADTAAGADTTAPAPPANVTLSSSGTGKITLTWTIPTVLEETNSGAVGYSGANIYRLVNKPDTTYWANPSILVKTAASTDTTWTDTDITSGNVYYYRLTSFDAASIVNQSFLTDTKSVSADTPVGAVSKMILSNNHQMGSLGLALSKQLCVTLTDDTGTPVKGETLTFSVSYPSGSGAALTKGTVVSDTNGLACDTLTLGSKRGPYHVMVSSASNSKLKATFIAYVDGLDISAGSFKMIAPNKSLSASTVLALIQDDLPKSTVVEWNQDAGASAGLNDYVTPSSIQRGRGYWIYEPAGGALDFQGTTGFDTVTVYLKAGWQQVGAGQYFFVSWDSGVWFDTGSTKLTPSQADSAGLIQNAVYWYTGSGYTWGPDKSTPSLSTVQLKPMIGFFIYAKKSCTMTVYPNPSIPSDTATEILQQAPTFLEGTNDANWAVRLSAQAGGQTDIQNYVGVKPTPQEAAQSGLYDPPAAAGKYVSLGIVTDDGVNRAASYVEPITTLKSWTLKIATDMDTSVTLAWENVATIPSKYAAYLVGAPAGPLDLRKNSRSILNPQSSSLTLVVGLPDYLAGFLAAPLSKDFTYAYPNPGPDGNGILFFKHNVISGAVSLKIYDVGGRLIKELSATASPIQWDTTNRFGQKVGSGVYVYILQAEGTKLVDKLAIIR